MPRHYLIVDDSPVIRLTLERMLRKHSVDEERIHIAEGGQEALDRFPELGPDVVFMDMMMPDMGGDQCASLMLQENPRLKVIIVTGLSRDEEPVRKLVSLGAFDVVEKPIRSGDVRRVLELIREEEGGTGRIR